MDPDETLRRIVAIAYSTDPLSVSDAIELAVGVRNLDHWLRKGGHLPQAWQIGRTSRTGKGANAPVRA
jgi:hypothetical protein